MTNSNKLSDFIRKWRISMTLLSEKTGIARRSISAKSNTSSAKTSFNRHEIKVIGQVIDELKEDWEQAKKNIIPED